MPVILTACHIIIYGYMMLVCQYCIATGNSSMDHNIGIRCRCDCFVKENHMILILMCLSMLLSILRTVSVLKATNLGIDTTRGKELSGPRKGHSEDGALKRTTII